MSDGKFTSENQPSPKSKSEGWKRRRAKKEADQTLHGLSMRPGSEGYVEAKQLLDKYGIDDGVKDHHITISLLVLLRQLKSDSYRSADLVLNRILGKLTDKVDLTNAPSTITVNVIRRKAAKPSWLRDSELQD